MWNSHPTLKTLKKIWKSYLGLIFGYSTLWKIPTFHTSYETWPFSYGKSRVKKFLEISIYCTGSSHTLWFILYESRNLGFVDFSLKFLGQWQNRIESAFEHLTHHAIRSGVEKVINVWDTRTVFPKESIEKMRTVLVTAKANHKGIYTRNHRFFIYQFR